jgi:tetratricopeptide (TPR) repeat protein
MNTLKNILVACLCCLFILLLSCAIDQSKKRVDIPALSASGDTLALAETCKLLSLDIASRRGWPDDGAIASFYRMLENTSDSLSRALGKEARTVAGERAIVSVAYGNWKLTFDRRDDAIEAILPHLVFRNKKGNCMGVSLVLLMLAQRLQCPLYGVVLPGHFFCRYDDGTERLNIEPNREGYRHPDDYYRAKYLSPGSSWYDLRNLTPKEAAGVFYYTVGTLFLKRNDPGLAAACLGESRRRVPFLVEASGNYALSLALCGRGDSALAVFEDLFVRNPSFPNLAANYGDVALAFGKCPRALEIYKKGLALFPSDPKLLLALSRASAACGRGDSGRAMPP